jgi:hypothetical protein
MSHALEFAAAGLVVGWSLVLVGFIGLCVRYAREQHQTDVVTRIAAYTHRDGGRT